MQNGDIIRQGDVFLIPRNPITYGNVFKYHRIGIGFRHKGEGGNHEHVIDNCESVHTELGMNFLRLREPSVMRHVALLSNADEGHASIEVPAGLYEARVSKEWRPENRRVHAD